MELLSRTGYLKPRLNVPVKHLGRIKTIEGPPEGITFEELDGLCHRYLGDNLTYVAHRRFSGHIDVRLTWSLFSDYRPVLKSRATFRIYLKTKRGVRWSLICKNDPRPQKMSEAAEYWFYSNIQGQLEAPTEYLIYNNTQAALADYLPAPFRCAELSTELTKGRFYQYLLEDLYDYRKVKRPEHIFRVVARLPELHRALNEWSKTINQRDLFRSDSLTSSITKELTHYKKISAHPLLQTIYDLWSHLQKVAELEDFRYLKELSPIHGDLWPDNVLIQPNYAQRVKIIDWESLCMGRRHADLANLLMNATSAVQEQALSIYATNLPELSLAEHRRLFNWCRLEYCLLKAVSCAREHVEFSAAPMTLPAYVKRTIAELGPWLKDYQIKNE